MTFRSDLLGPQIVFVSIRHFAPDLVARLEVAAIVDKHVAVDFRGVEEAAANRALLVDFVHQHFDFAANAQLQAQRDAR